MTNKANNKYNKFLLCLKKHYPNWVGYYGKDENTNNMVNDLVKKNVCKKKISYGNGYKFLSVKLSWKELL